MSDNAATLYRTTRLFQRDELDPNAVLFVNEASDGVMNIRMGLDIWLDMGRPDTVTVTLTPGDSLNVEEQSA
jgi:hypothetical protein